MGIEAVRTYLKSGNMDKLSTPPGFASQTSFVLKQVSNDKDSSNLSGSRQSSRLASGQEITLSNMADAQSFKRSLWNRPWILHDQTSLSSETLKPLKHEVPGRRFPKVQNAEVLDEAPVFHPTEEEFSDTLVYIASLRERAEPHGICCVVPPPSWKPPCHLEDKKIREDSSFSTQVQLFGGIQTEDPEMKKDANGDAKNSSLSKKVRSCRIDIGPKYTLDKFKNFADSYKNQHFSMKDEVSGSRKSSPSLKREDPSVADIEQEYTQLVESPSIELGVLYGNDLDTSVVGSGFTSSAASESCKYSELGWNLNVTAKLPGSLLSFEESKSVCVPRLCVGMCFSSQLWRAEKDSLYSLCYLHLGAPKVWYAVPGHCSFQFKTTTENFISEFAEEDPETHCQTVMTMSPYVLSTQGIPVTRCVQSPGQFVIIFPGSYYSGFDTGFNCLERANFAPLDWLPHGDAAVLRNQEKRKKSSVSYDKLLFGAAMEAVKSQSESLLFRKCTSEIMRWKDACGTDGILYKVLKSRVKQEKNRIKYLSNPLQSQKMDQNYDEASRECCICFADLHLSAVRCSGQCPADRYSCLIHAKQLCPCPNKIFMHRYTIDDLDVLVEAMEGKYSAIYKWARQYLNFSASSSVLRQDTRTDAAATIKAQVKARVKSRSLEQIMKVKEDEDASPAAPGGKTSEKLLPKRGMASNGELNISSVSQVEGKSSQLKGCTSGKKTDKEESSKQDPLKKSSPKKSTRPSDSSAFDNPKRQKQT